MFDFIKSSGIRGRLLLSTTFIEGARLPSLSRRVRKKEKSSITGLNFWEKKKKSFPLSEFEPRTVQPET